MPEGLSLLFLVALAVVSAVALLTVLNLMFPKALERTSQAADTMPGRSFLIGLIWYIFLGAVITGLTMLGNNLDIGLFQIPALLLIVLTFALAVFGIAGMVLLIGGRMLPEQAWLKRTIWGGVIVVLACLLPYVGSHGLFPLLGMMGSGAFVIGLVRREGGEKSEGEGEE